MSILAELAATVLGEAVGLGSQSLFNRFTRVLKLWMVWLAWALTPVIEWAIFRFSARHDSLWSFFVVVFVSIGWPVFALLATIAYFEKQRHRGRFSP
jgi:hypothetical protein